MKRLLLCLVLVTALVLVTGCGGKKTASGPGPTSTGHTPVTLTVWHLWTIPSEKKGFTEAVAGFHKLYPWITLKLIPYPDASTFDQEVIKDTKAGIPPDVILSFGPDYVGQYASGGILQDLKPYMERDHFSMDQFAPAALTYCQFAGKVVALPVLTDSYGLYYNKDMLAKAGISGPPKTMTELMADAKQLTVRGKNNSIDVAGFVPVDAFYETTIGDLARAWGGTYFDASGKPHLATDPAWAAAMTWQKQLIDWYGATPLKTYVGAHSGGNTEWGAEQAFETGKLAMNIDGEWRTRMIANEVPDLNYGTVPFPAADDHPDVYGSGLVGGTITGIPVGAKHSAEAWLLVKYLSTNTDFLVSLANALGNVPTTKASAASPNLHVPPQFQTFIDVWNNPNSSMMPPLTASGAGYNDLLATFDEKWEYGGVPDLHAGLSQLDQQISDQLVSGGTGP